jgi:hypothetical protein
MNAPTNSELLWGKIRLADGRLFAATHTFWNHPELPELLPRFLIQTHCLMQSGLTMMAVAIERARHFPGDSVARDLANYLDAHLQEELGHDKWLLDDIRTLGFEEQEVLRAQPCAASVALVGAQYFWMMHVHPVAIMGYLILMEGYAPIASQLEDIRMRSGAPESAFRCLRRHAEDDPAHLADLNCALDRMNLSVEQACAVGMCAFAAIDGIAAMFEELMESCVDTGTAGTEQSGRLQHAGA